MKSLYLRIYLTVVAVLLLFALVAGGIAHWRLKQEQREGQQRVQALWAERAQAWAELLERNLPPATAPVDEQAAAVLDWSRRLRQPMALDDAHGRRIATSPRLQELLEQHDADEPPPGLLRHELSDGRVLWVARRPQRDARPPGAPPGWLPADRDRDRGGPRGRGADAPDVPPWWAVATAWPGSGMALMLVGLFTAVAAGAWPVVRRLTLRLERLKQGVERFGAGELDHRVAVDGRDEVATVARSFNEAAQRIEDLVRAHRSLLANASHELRSPLARLKMALALMEDAPPERRRALRAEIEHDIGELDQLVEEVLLSSRLDARVGTLQQPVDALAVAAEEAMRWDARLDIVEPPAGSVQPVPGWRLSGDERLLRRALRNLLENARRHGQPVARDPGAWPQAAPSAHAPAPAAGAAQASAPPAWPAAAGDAAADVDAAVLLEVAQRRGADGRGEVVFRVLDRGPGVPEAERERIFEPFYRRAGHGEGAGGVGLGLALVRQIARGHGGSVHCEARPGGGSAFVLVVPAQAAQQPGGQG